MEIGKKFNTLTMSQYKHYIENHKKYTDFNTLGLYRSLKENEKLNDEQRIEIRDFAHEYFHKSFVFLQLKDPGTYFELEHLGVELDEPQKRQLWKDIWKYQEKYIKENKTHRNFGVYSKHDCGYDTCYYNGLMIKQGSALTEDCISFNSDNNNFWTKKYSKKVNRKKDRKNKNNIIRDELNKEY